MSINRELLKAFFDPANPTELALAFGGLFACVLKLEWDAADRELRAAAAKKGAIVKDEDRFEEMALELAFDRVAKTFPAPIDANLQSQRADFLSAFYSRN